MGIGIGNLASWETAQIWVFQLLPAYPRKLPPAHIRNVSKRSQGFWTLFFVRCAETERSRDRQPGAGREPLQDNLPAFYYYMIPEGHRDRSARLC